MSDDETAASAAFKRIAAEMAEKIQADMLSQLVTTGTAVATTSAVPGSDPLTFEMIKEAMANLPPVLIRIECREDEYIALKRVFLVRRPDPRGFGMDALEVRIWEDEKIELPPGVGVAVYSNGKREAMRVLSLASDEDIRRVEKELTK